MGYKFRTSKLDKLNKKFRKKPYKYVYKEIFPRKVFEKIQKKIYYRTQKKIAKEWNKVLVDYFENKIEISEITQKKQIKNDKIIWQFWGQGWEYKKLPKVIKISSSSVKKYKKDCEIYYLDMNNIEEYLKIPKYILEKIENKKMSYAHFTDIIRLALLYYYGGVWLDATVLLTDNIPQKYFEMEYFMFQRDDNLKDKKKWEDFDSVYFSWDKDMRIRVMNSVIFAKKNSKVIKTLLDLLLIFWKDNEKAPKYFFFQILYYELMKNYYKKYQCEIISDTYSHELMRVWYEKYKEKEFEKIKEKTSIHKLSFKWGTAEEEYENTYFRYLKKLYNI